MPLDAPTRVQMTESLLNIEDARSQLYSTDPSPEVIAQIAVKSLQATNVILDYLKAGADPAWTPTTVPYPVQAAIMRMLSHLYDDRGGERSGPGDTADARVWEEVTELLARFRDPTIA